MAHHASAAACGIVIGCLACACTGAIGTPTGNESGSDRVTGDGAGATGSGRGGSTSNGGGPATSSGEYHPGPARLRRLTSIEYTNSVIDLLGPGTKITTAFEKDTSYNNLTSVAASTISLSATITEQFETSAYALAEGLVKDPARRQTVVGCTPTGAADQACMRTFVTSFGRRAFRRPLTADEVALYLAVGTNAMAKLTDFWAGVQYALAAVLQSPNFLYRTEFGNVDAATLERRPLTGFEVAARLSYLLRSSTPDDALLDAAAAGALAGADGLRQHAERLLAGARSQEAIVGVFGQVLRLGELEELPLSPELFPQAASATLAASMRKETENAIRDIVFTRNADYREFLTSEKTWVNAELAELYRLPPVAGAQFVNTTLPANGPRAGYLGQASFLALNSHPTHTSPTQRGLFITGTLMCDSIPPPPEGVVAELQDKDRAATMRVQLAAHQQLASCAGCHSRMDPMGLALEQFDAVGAYRETDRGMPLDVTGTIGGVPFNGARQLGQVLASGPKTSEGNLETMDCVVRNLFRAATGHLETEGEEGAVTALSNDFAGQGYRVQAFLIKLVTSDAFRLVGKPE